MRCAAGPHCLCNSFICTVGTLVLFRKFFKSVRRKGNQFGEFPKEKFGFPEYFIDTVKLRLELSVVPLSVGTG